MQKKYKNYVFHCRYHGGNAIKECMIRASKAAAISVTRPGAADSIPWAKEL
jgi:sugar/nucleoside kinase (ribokinase family)